MLKLILDDYIINIIKFYITSTFILSKFYINSNNKYI